MKTIVHKSDTRGYADHGWLQSYHSFSFASYYNPERMHFGLIRVLNDDTVAPGRGFGTHPHDNMEIISIPLEGDLEHKDSMGNLTRIRKGEIQVMSAGTGITHSEYNGNEDQEVKFLQIWIFPREKGLTPRYDQISLNDIRKENELYQVLSPYENDQGVWIHQDAWFYLGEFTEDTSTRYQMKNENNGVYVFVLDGVTEIEGQSLSSRDALGAWETSDMQFTAYAGSRVLLMEVPMSP
jgi:redox-sensitive bicupin YhaK (pirin superfamily)